MINIIGKDYLDNVDFKLLVVTGAEKADNNSGLTKVVSASIRSGVS